MIKNNSLDSANSWFEFILILRPAGLTGLMLSVSHTLFRN